MHGIAILSMECSAHVVPLLGTAEFKSDDMGCPIKEEAIVRHSHF